MEDGDIKGSERVSARRRLVRGVFATPAVLALHSGSALAAASNLRCVNNQVASPVRPPAMASPSDTYVRVRLWSLRQNDTSKSLDTIRWYLSGSDVDAVRFGHASIYNAFLRGGEWWQFDPASQVLMGSKLLTTPVWSSGNAGYWAQDGVWVAVRFNASSTEAGIVGVVDGNIVGSAVSGSCWTSFVNAAL